MQDREFGDAALGCFYLIFCGLGASAFFFLIPRGEKATKNNRWLFQNSTRTGQRRDYCPFRSAATHYTPPFFNFSAINFFCS